MKLIRICHTVCSDYDGCTYMFAPNNKSEDEIDDDISNCVDQFINNQKELLNAKENKIKYPSENLREYDDNITIVEAKKVYNENIKKYTESRNRISKLSKSFTTLMKEKGYKSLDDLEEDNDEITEHSAYWGHCHGINILK